MSVSSSTSTISYTGNGSTSTAYTVPFAFYDATDLKVYSVNASGVSTLLTLTTNYTVSGGGGSTGSVTTTAAIPSTSTVLINRTVPYTQLTSFTTGDRLPANSIEAALDKLTMEAQQLSRNTLPDTAATTGSAPYVLGVSATGGNPSWVPQSSSGIADGSITTSKLSAGHPNWTTDGVLTPAGNLILNNNYGVYGTDVAGTIRTLLILDATDTLTIRNNSGGDGGLILFESKPNGGISALLDTNGYFGIGTQSPATQLDVAGAINARNDNTSGWILFAPKYGTDVFGANWDRFEIRIDPTSQVTYLGNSSGGTGQSRSLAFTTGATERMRIDTSGNVGIGTTSPTVKLDVLGNIKAGSAGLQVGLGNVTSGYYGDSTNLAARLPSTAGYFYIQQSDGSGGWLTHLAVSSGNINALGNPITNSSTTAKAWVNFSGTTVSSVSATVTRVAGSTTATVTTASAHNLTTGNSVYALTGVVAGLYIVTVSSSTIFTITTVATTALSAASMTYQVNTIRSSYNVSSVAKISAGMHRVNFSSSIAAGYSVCALASNDASNPCFVEMNELAAGGGAPTTNSVGVRSVAQSAGTWVAQDTGQFSVTIFGN
jgi:hypothetical protein